MSTRPRFRDSWLIRIGVGIIGFWFLVISGFEAAYYLFGFNPDAGPTFIWLVFWVLVAFLCISIGFGQTIVRRRRSRVL